jgi:hypothetical protein
MLVEAIIRKKDPASSTYITQHHPEKNDHRSPA